MGFALVDFVHDRVRSRALGVLIACLVLTLLTELMLIDVLKDPYKYLGSDDNPKLSIIGKSWWTTDFRNRLAPGANKLLVRAVDGRGMSLSDVIVRSQVRSESHGLPLNNDLLVKAMQGPGESVAPALSLLRFCANNGTLQYQSIQHMCSLVMYHGIQVTDADGFANYSNMVPAYGIPGQYYLDLYTEYEPPNSLEGELETASVSVTLLITANISEMAVSSPSVSAITVDPVASGTHTFQNQPVVTLRDSAGDPVVGARVGALAYGPSLRSAATVSGLAKATVYSESVALLTEALSGNSSSEGVAEFGSLGVRAASASAFFIMFLVEGKELGWQSQTGMPLMLRSATRVDISPVTGFVSSVHPATRIKYNEASSAACGVRVTDRETGLGVPGIHVIASVWHCAGLGSSEPGNSRCRDLVNPVSMPSDAAGVAVFENLQFESAGPVGEHEIRFLAAPYRDNDPAKPRGVSGGGDVSITVLSAVDHSGSRVFVRTEAYATVRVGSSLRQQNMAPPAVSVAPLEAVAEEEGFTSLAGEYATARLIESQNSCPVSLTGAEVKVEQNNLASFNDLRFSLLDPSEVCLELLGNGTGIRIELGFYIAGEQVLPSATYTLVVGNTTFPAAALLSAAGADELPSVWYYDTPLQVALLTNVTAGSGAAADAVSIDIEVTTWDSDGLAVGLVSSPSLPVSDASGVESALLEEVSFESGAGVRRPLAIEVTVVAQTAATEADPNPPPLVSQPWRLTLLPNVSGVAVFVPRSRDVVLGDTIELSVYGNDCDGKMVDLVCLSCPNYWMDSSSGRCNSTEVFGSTTVAVSEVESGVCNASITISSNIVASGVFLMSAACDEVHSEGFRVSVAQQVGFLSVPQWGGDAASCVGEVFAEQPTVLVLDTNGDPAPNIKVRAVVNDTSPSGGEENEWTRVRLGGMDSLPSNASGYAVFTDLGFLVAPHGLGVKLHFAVAPSETVVVPVLSEVSPGFLWSAKNTLNVIAQNLPSLSASHSVPLAVPPQIQVVETDPLRALESPSLSVPIFAFIRHASVVGVSAGLTGDEITTDVSGAGTFSDLALTDGGTGEYLIGFSVAGRVSIQSIALSLTGQPVALTLQSQIPGHILDPDDPPEEQFVVGQTYSVQVSAAISSGAGLAYSRMYAFLASKATNGELAEESTYSLTDASGTAAFDLALAAGESGVYDLRFVSNSFVSGPILLDVANLVTSVSIDTFALYEDAVSIGVVFYPPVVATVASSFSSYGGSVAGLQITPEIRRVGASGKNSISIIPPKIRSSERFADAGGEVTFDDLRVTTGSSGIYQIRFLAQGVASNWSASFEIFNQFEPASIDPGQYRDIAFLSIPLLLPLFVGNSLFSRRYMGKSIGSKAVKGFRHIWRVSFSLSLSIIIAGLYSYLAFFLVQEMAARTGRESLAYNVRVFGLIHITVILAWLVYFGVLTFLRPTRSEVHRAVKTLRRHSQQLYLRSPRGGGDTAASAASAAAFPPEAAQGPDASSARVQYAAGGRRASVKLRRGSRVVVDIVPGQSMSRAALPRLVGAQRMSVNSYYERKMRVYTSHVGTVLREMLGRLATVNRKAQAKARGLHLNESQSKMKAALAKYMYSTRHWRTRWWGKVERSYVYPAIDYFITLFAAIKEIVMFTLHLKGKNPVIFFPQRLIVGVSYAILASVLLAATWHVFSQWIIFFIDLTYNQFAVFQKTAENLLIAHRVATDTLAQTGNLLGVSEFDLPDVSPGVLGGSSSVLSDSAVKFLEYVLVLKKDDFEEVAEGKQSQPE